MADRLTERIRDRGRARRRVAAAGAVGAWGALVAASVLWGHALNRERYIGVTGPPFNGDYESLLTARVVLPVLVGLALIIGGPPLFDRVPWRWLPAVCGTASVGWGLLLHRIDDKTLTEPLTTRYDYLAGVPDVTSPLEYVRTYTERLSEYPTHPRGHPPGAVLLAWSLEQVGLDGANPWLVVILTAWAVGIGSVLIALRAVAGETAARRVGLPLTVAPAAVWVVSSTDPLFAGVSTVGLAMVVVALVNPAGRRRDALAAGGGAVFGAALLLTYGAAPLVAVPAAVAALQRRLRPLLVAGAAGTAVVLLPLATGFWWFDGLAATRVEYEKGLASIRPYSYFAVANLAAFAVACGPAVALGLASTRLDRRRTWVLAAGGLAAVLMADLSGMSKAEVERIWLPFLPWVITVVAATDERTIPRRLLVGSQITCAVVVQIILRSSW